MGSFLDKFFILDVLIVAAVVFLDLRLAHERRVVLARRVLDRWAVVKKISAARLLAQSATHFHQVFVAVFGKSPLRLRFTVLALSISAIVGGITLVAGALAFLRDPSAAIVPATRFFAVPTIACGWLAFALDCWLFAALSRTYLLPAQFGLFVLRLVTALALWLALMHAGTWMEWQQKRTPLAYGSEWFYAEAYWYYLREPEGRLVSFATGVVVALAPVLFVASTTLLTTAKLLYPILGPVLSRLLDVFCRVRRGVFAAAAVAVGLLAKLAQELVRAL